MPVFRTDTVYYIVTVLKIQHIGVFNRFFAAYSLHRH